jgi:hypothetical protein
MEDASQRERETERRKIKEGKADASSILSLSAKQFE